MLWTLIVLLLLFWLLGFAFDIAGGIIHAIPGQLDQRPANGRLAPMAHVAP